MRARHLVGLDIGTTVVKAIEVRELKGKLQVTNFGVAQIAPETSPADAVSELFARRKFRTKRVVSAVSGRSVYIRFVNMPLRPDEEVAGVAKSELAKFMPVEVNDVIHDAQKLEQPEPTPGQEPEMRVVLAAAKRALIDEHVALLEACGLEPTIIDVEAFALGNAYDLEIRTGRQPAAGRTTVAIVDIGTTKTTLHVMQGSRSLFTREIYRGGADLTAATAGSPGTSIRRKGDTGTRTANLPIVIVGSEDAGKLRDDTKVVPIVIVGQEDATKMRRAIAAGAEAEPEPAPGPRVSNDGALEDFCNDLKISIDYFETQNDLKVDELLLAGGWCAFEGVAETLERILQKPIRRWNPFTEMELALDAEAQKELQQYADLAPIALGLASRILPD